MKPRDYTKKVTICSIIEVPETIEKRPSGVSHDRDVVLEKLEKEKIMSFVRAWEDSEKDKAENKAQQKLTTVTAWENTKKAAVEAKLRSMEEKLEKKKQYREKMKKQIGALHKQADEKKAMIQVDKGQEILKAEEMAAKSPEVSHYNGHQKHQRPFALEVVSQVKLVELESDLLEMNANNEQLQRTYNELLEHKIVLRKGLISGSAELRERAAPGLGELIEVTSEKTLKEFVIPITG